MAETVRGVRSYSFKRLTFQIPFLFMIFMASATTAQIRCATVEYEKALAKKYPTLESRDQFEKWMEGKIKTLKFSKNLLGNRTESINYIIPVVVHIIHNGEAIGKGTNISDAQILSQIDAINRDYPRRNADSVKTYDAPGARFKEVAGKINIQFVLAKQDPEGVATNGITRTKGTQTSWNESADFTADDATLKALSYWPSEDYLNVWVANLQNGVLGYSQQPVSSGLPGLSMPPPTKYLDGTVIHYQVFGDNSNGGNFPVLSEYDKGRTATHEIGHVLGLRHVWGDVTTCTGTDYCSDTPTQSAPTFGCPAPVLSVVNGVTTIDSSSVKSCGHPKMFQNYMDYTDDACYNLFSKDQVNRMVVVLANSPRRASLLTSHGSVEPDLIANDLGARKIITPYTSACAGVAVTPVLQIRNYGDNTVTSARVQFSLDGAVTETQDFALNLAPLDTVNVTFSPLTFAAATTYTLSFTILLTNGVTDGNSNNNTFAASISTASEIALPFVEQFNTLPATWSVVNPDAAAAGLTWQNTTAPYTIASNKAMFMDFYDYETRNEQDRLVSPVFDLSSATVAVLKFDRAYAVFSATTSDQLRIVVSTSCDAQNQTEIFNKAGTALATAGITQNSFVPTGSQDWKTESIDLSQFLGQSHVQISFIGINQNGNNLYLDNISVTTEAYTDIAITEIKSPTPVSCATAPVPILTISNLGSLPITSFSISGTVNTSEPIAEQTFSGFELQTGQEQDFTLNPWSLHPGVNTIKLAVTTPGADISPANNNLTLNIVSNSAQALIPFLETFDDTYAEWSLVNPLHGANWVPVTTGTPDKKISLEYAAFSNPIIGDKAWLVSPVLPLGDVPAAGLSFDFSYFQNFNKVDELQIFGSTDCGATYNILLFDQRSDSLSLAHGDSKLNSAWVPQQDNDWQNQFVSLDKLAGSTQARVAFVVTNGNGNNLFIDNIEFYLHDDTFLIKTDPLFSVYNNFTPDVKVTFNLPEEETVRIQVVNGIGQSVVDETVDGVLHQTFPIDLTGKSPGVYIIRLQMGSQFGTAKAVIGN